jgi:hypothetical protein
MKQAIAEALQPRMSYAKAARVLCADEGILACRAAIGVEISCCEITAAAPPHDGEPLNRSAATSRGRGRTR